MCVQYSIKERFKFIYLHNTSQLHETTFSMMIIRDPIDRLVSAYKNHVACDGVFKWKGPSDRDEIVPHLLKLREKEDKLYTDVMSMTEAKRCFSFDQYATVLLDIHHLGKDSLLNGHFRPQSCDCFIEPAVSTNNATRYQQYRVPNFWTAVGTISNADMFQRFHEHLIHNGLPRNSSQFFPPPKARSIPDPFHPHKRLVILSHIYIAYTYILHTLIQSSHQS